ncbi:MAG: amino acid adenylation domain-containing protein [bacterium]
MTTGTTGNDAYPVSYAQELLFLLERAAPGLTAYNVSRVRRLRGALDLDALQRALDTLVERHEILRTTYGFHDEHAIQIIAPASRQPLRVVDLAGRESVAAEAEALAQVRAAIRTPFDLANDRLLRATLFRLAHDDAFLLLETHHIASDGWSRDVMFRELGTLYAAYRAGSEPQLPVLPIQYVDFAIWQREQLAGDKLQGLLDYWRGALAGAADELALPTDFPRPAHPTFEGAQQPLVLSASLTAKVRAFAQQQQTSLYMLVLAAYQTVLHRWTGQDDILVGSPIAGRALAETEGLIGYFANTLVLRGTFGDDPTFATLLGRVRETALGAYEHQEIPFEKLVLELREGQARLSHAPLFQVVLTQLDATPTALELSGLTLEPVGFESGATKFDFTLFMSDRADGLRFTLGYRSDLFRKDTAERFLDHLRLVLESAVALPNQRVSEISLLSPAAHAQLAAWNDTTVNEGPSATFVSLFEAQAARVSSRAAVVSPRASATAAGSVAGTLALTYGELNARANQLAHHLRSLGVGTNTPVGLLLDRSGDAFVGLVGILKAGGAYVPLSVDVPASRIAQQIAECGATIVVTAQALADRVPAGLTVIALDREADAAILGASSDANPSSVVSPEDLAYVLYTSGSTGTPKGVAVTHANIVHYTRAVSRVLADVPRAQAGDGLKGLDGLRFGLVSTLAADLGMTSSATALLAGGTLHVLSKDVTMDPSKFAEYVSVHPFDVLKITPNHLAALIAGKSGAELAGVLPKRWVITGGEALRFDTAQALLSARSCRVLNHYGPTETTVGVCTFEVTGESLQELQSLGAQTVPVGHPLSNSRVFVVDARGHEQPVGIPGELYVGGMGVANGYLRKPELTTEKFVQFNSERVYRSGDRVRRLTNGAVEFLGRADDQVKVRGFRVELGEIEHVLRGHPGVAQGVVILRTDDDAGPRLVAYVVAKAAGYAVSHGDRPTAEKLMEWFAAQLPDYMNPSAVVLLEALPLTPNGKVDARALPVPGATTMTAEDAQVAPSTETERQLVTIWMDVLKKESVGVTDNFLAMGGHSLLAIRVLGKISRAFGVRLPLRTLFDAPTIAQLAEVVELEQKIAALDRMAKEDAASEAAARGSTTE